MLVFEPQISDVGSNPSANCATTTAPSHSFSFFLSLALSVLFLFTPSFLIVKMLLQPFITVCHFNPIQANITKDVYTTVTT